MAQPKSNIKSPQYARLRKLRLVTGKTWQQLADDLGLDRSMFFHVKAGTRNLSEKALYRLRLAECAAGIEYSPRELIGLGLSARQTAETLLEQEPEQNEQVTSGDIDRGFVDVDVDFKAGRPKGNSAKLRVTAPANEKVLPLTDRIRFLQIDPNPLLALCLPADKANRNYLNHLTPTSYRKVVEAAMALTFGLRWREELKGK